jgi:putative ABC transport system permease protein
MTFVVKTGPESAGMVNQIKAAIRTVNPNQTFARVAPMDQLVADSLRQRRFNLFLLVSFALVALGLAAVGIYGSINYSTQLRTREIGVRMALGAQAIDILRMIVLQGLTITFAGIIIGLVTTIMLTRLMSGLLFGVSASDPVTLVAISLLILLIALIASYVPAWRATKLDPLIALRYE